MTKEYLEIKRELYDKRIDLTFSPEKLNMLTDLEREEIEGILIDYSMKGISCCFQYIPYIKIKDPNVILSSSIFDKLSTRDQLVIMKNLYIHSGNPEYFNYIYDMASYDVDAYDMLLDICVYFKKNGIDVSLFYDELLEMTKNNVDDNIYQFLYNNKLKR